MAHFAPLFGAVGPSKVAKRLLIDRKIVAPVGVRPRGVKVAPAPIAQTQVALPVAAAQFVAPSCPACGPCASCDSCCPSLNCPPCPTVPTGWAGNTMPTAVLAPALVFKNDGFASAPAPPHVIDGGTVGGSSFEIPWWMVALAIAGAVAVSKKKRSA